MCGSGLCGPCSPAPSVGLAAAPECADCVPRVDRVLAWSGRRALEHPRVQGSQGRRARPRQTSSLVQTSKTRDWLLRRQQLHTTHTNRGQRRRETGVAFAGQDGHRSGTLPSARRGANARARTAEARGKVTRTRGEALRRPQPTCTSPRHEVNVRTYTARSQAHAASSMHRSESSAHHHANSRWNTKAPQGGLSALGCCESIPTLVSHTSRVASPHFTG
jgi:hypothetical protein